MKLKAWKRSKIASILLVFFLISLITLTGCGGNSNSSSGGSTPEPSQGAEDTSQQVFNLTLAHFQVPLHPVETILIQDWIKEIDEATGGRVKITSYPGGTLVPGTEIFESVVSGAVDIGHSAYAYTRGRFPIIETLLIPGLIWPNAKVADWTVMDLIDELNPEELKDVKHLFSWTTGRGDLLTQKTIKTMDDLKGISIGVTAAERAEALAKLGASGIVLSMPEQYEALSKGLTQGVVGPMHDLKNVKLADFLDHVTVTQMLYNQVLFMVMNLDTWNSFPPDIQEIFDEVTEKYYREVVAGFYDWVLADALEWLEEENIELEITYLSKEEEEKWISLVAPILDDHVKLLNDKGLPGDEIIDKIWELIEKNTKLYE